MNWIDMFKVGAEIHEPNKKLTVVDEAFIRDIFKNFEYCRAKNYEVTFLNNHGRTDSYVYGDVLAIRVHEGFVQGQVKFTRQAEQDAFDEGLMREFSPGFEPNWLEPHTGELRGPALMELSFTGSAYQRNLRQPQTKEAQSIHLSASNIIYGETIMSRKNMSKTETPAEEPKKEMEDTFEEEPKKEMAEPTLGDIAVILNEVLTLLKGKKTEMSDEPESKPEPKDDEETVKLHRRIRDLEDQNTRIQLSARGITGAPVEHLVKLHRVDRPLFEETMKLYKRQTPIGVTGLDTTGGEVNAETVAKAAKAAGKTEPADLRIFLSREYPDFAADREVNEVRKALSRIG